MRQHRSPCIPVMRPLFSPNIEFIPNTFIIKYLGKFSAGCRIFIRTATGEEMNMLALPDLLKYGMIRKIAHIMKRTVEVYIIIKITLGVFGEVIYTTHGNDTIDKIGSFQK